MTMPHEVTYSLRRYMREMWLMIAAAIEFPSNADELCIMSKSLSPAKLSAACPSSDNSQKCTS